MTFFSVYVYFDFGLCLYWLFGLDKERERETHTKRYKNRKQKQ